MKTEDIRITQYALGELTGPAREAFEKAMATDPELLEEVRQTQQFCESMPTSFEEEAIFSEAERAAMLKRIQTERMVAAEKKSPGAWSRIVIYGGLAAAACWMVMLSIPAVTGGLRRAQMTPKSEKVDSTFTVLAEPQVALTPAEPMTLAAQSRTDLDAALRQEVQAKLAMSSPASSDKLQDELKKQLTETSVSLATSTPAPTSFGGAAVSSSGNPAFAMELPAAPAPPPAVMVAGNATFGGVPADQRESRLVKEKSTVASVADGEDVLHNVARDRRLAEFNTEGYDYQEENRFLDARENPLSTFSIDVDTASYSNIRRFLQQQNQLPPKGAVRTEELINYFPYAYPQPEGSEPFSVNVEVSKAPWNPEHELVRIGLKGRELSAEKRPASNLVFLIDVSGSMNAPAKLPLLQKSLTELTARLAAKDRVAIVVYAGSSGLVLPSTADKSAIRDALDRLQAGGSTNGADGIKLAYREARENFIEEGNNRVILCTDGDFNVGITSEQALVDLIEKQRASGIFLSVLGFGTGNLKDSQMEKIADKGNGNYAYIDSIAEGRKVLGEQMGGTLFTIAKDVKIQVEFNPATVAGYRLIGYENRILAKEDFNNDKKDAGEIGAGHTVTAFYEVIPAGQPLPDADSVDPLKYQQPQPQPPSSPKSAVPNPQPSEARQTAEGSPKGEAKPSQSNELLTVKLRYKQPDGDTSKLLQVPVANEVKEWSAASDDFRFAAAVAAFGQKLRGSKTLKDFDWAAIQKLARPNLGDDPGSYRAEFLTLIEKARQIDENP